MCRRRSTLATWSFFKTIRNLAELLQAAQRCVILTSRRYLFRCIIFAGFVHFMRRLRASTDRMEIFLRVSLVEANWTRTAISAEIVLFMHRELAGALFDASAFLTHWLWWLEESLFISARNIYCYSYGISCQHCCEDYRWEQSCIH